ncbi:MAG: DUF4412 domain-containing protein [Bacteroidota bacterium]
MNPVRKILIILFFSVISTNLINAQFLKKFKQRVKYAAEEAVIMKAEEKAAGETGKVVDKLLNIDLKKMMKSKTGSPVDPSVLPDTYDFDWNYTMQMETKDGSFIINYFLKSGVKYFGSKPDIKQPGTTGDMYTVMDMDRHINTIFIDMDGSKKAMANSVPIAMDFESDEGTANNDYTFKEIGTKEILGYTCQGFIMENDEMKMIIYAAMEAPVSFSQIFGMKTDKAPKGFNPKWLGKMESSLVMEVQYQDKKKNKNHVKMRCVSLNEELFSIEKNEYEFMKLGEVPEEE